MPDKRYLDISKSYEECIEKIEDFDQSIFRDLYENHPDSHITVINFSRNFGANIDMNTANISSSLHENCML